MGCMVSKRSGSCRLVDLKDDHPSGYVGRDIQPPNLKLDLALLLER